MKEGRRLSSQTLPRAWGKHCHPSITVWSWHEAAVRSANAVWRYVEQQTWNSWQKWHCARASYKIQNTVVYTEERATETRTSCKVISLKSEKQQVHVTKKAKRAHSPVLCCPVVGVSDWLAQSHCQPCLKSSSFNLACQIIKSSIPSYTFLLSTDNKDTNFAEATCGYASPQQHWFRITSFLRSWCKSFSSSQQQHNNHSLFTPSKGRRFFFFRINSFLDRTIPSFQTTRWILLYATSVSEQKLEIKTLKNILLSPTINTLWGNTLNFCSKNYISFLLLFRLAFLNNSTKKLKPSPWNSTNKGQIFWDLP